VPGWDHYEYYEDLDLRPFVVPAAGSFGDRPAADPTAAPDDGDGTDGGGHEPHPHCLHPRTAAVRIRHRGGLLFFLATYVSLL